MLEPTQYQNKTMQSGIFLLRYRTEMTDARMPMLALVLRMPMRTMIISPLFFQVSMEASLVEEPSGGSKYCTYDASLYGNSSNVSTQ
jgi:hypothetical protein